QHRGRAAGADIEDRALRRHDAHRGEQRRHDIGDIDEIANLLAVAEDPDPGPGAQPVAEDGDDAGIGRGRILARAEDVEKRKPTVGTPWTWDATRACSSQPSL